MADNYLEKKMEDRARAAASRIVSSRPRKGTVVLPFPPRTVVAWSHDVVAGSPFAAAVRALAEAGCRIALLTESTPDSGRRTASALGARYLPFNAAQAMEYVCSQWDAPDMLIVDGAQAPQPLVDAFASVCAKNARAIAFADVPLQLPGVAISNAISPANPSPAQAALILALPAATFSGIAL